MTDKPRDEKPMPLPADDAGADPVPDAADTPASEVGGRSGPEPTRYGDWEVGGICTDF